MTEFILLDGSKLKQTIDERDLKMWWCAEQAGIHRSTLRRWISGEITRVHVARAGKLGEVLGVSVSEIAVI